MSAILRYICYGFTALGILAILIGLATDNAPAVRAGVQVAFLFAILSALLHVKRVI